MIPASFSAIRGITARRRTGCLIPSRQPMMASAGWTWFAGLKTLVAHRTAGLGLEGGDADKVERGGSGHDLDGPAAFLPRGEHMAVVTEARIVSPGIVRDTMAKLTCLPEGWLQ